MKNRFSGQFPSPRDRHPFRRSRLRSLLLCGVGLIAGWVILLSQDHTSDRVAAQGVQKQEDQLIRSFKLPSSPPAPVYRPQAPVYHPEPEPIPESGSALESVPVPEAISPPEAVAPQPPLTIAPNPDKKPESTEPNGLNPLSQYTLEFNRSPAIGNRFRLEGTYSEARLGFTRPQGWKVKSAKAVIRFQHSPDLLKDRSNLIVRVNDRSLDRVPLNLKQAQVGEAIVNIPSNLIQDYNEISVVAQQQNSPNCSNPRDKVLWSEVLPDSKLVFDYQPQPIALDFGTYPFPFFDRLGLDATRLNYLLPAQVSAAWLTSASRFQTQMGRLADFRPLETQLVKDLKNFERRDRLIMIGTPDEQPALKTLDLPMTIVNHQILDSNKTALPEDVGILMLATVKEGSVPALIVTGNSAAGVAKAVQFLVQPQTSKIGTGQAITVNELAEVSSPNPRQWSRYLPLQNSFNLSDLKGLDNKPVKDMTVRGSSAPPVQFSFRALPDDSFLRGSSMNLHYSHSVQINPRESTIEVRIDGVGVGSKKLSSDAGATDETLNVDLPKNLIKTNSVIDVSFKLTPKQINKCGQSSDDQLWGTVHANTSFNLKRETSVQLPDLQLLTTGFPFTAPQDLSKTAIVLPDSPSQSEVMTLMKVSERLGRLSQANTIKLDVYTAAKLPEPIKKDRNLVGIGIREHFPLQEVFAPDRGFRLMSAFARQSDQVQIQSIPDAGGVIKSIVSPWNPDRILVALSAQADSGLQQVQDVISHDQWFYQLQKDTVLINARQPTLSSLDSNAYQLQFLRQAHPQRIAAIGLLAKTRRFLQDHWFLLPTGIIALSFLLYGIAQLYLKRVAG